MTWKTEETRQKMLKILSDNSRKPRKKGRRNPPLSEETKQKISHSLKGIKHSPERAQKAAQTRIGKPRSEETKIKIGLYQTGEKNHNWKGGVSWQTKKKNHPDYIFAVSIKSDKCDICLTPETGLSRRLAFDHDHSSGKFRGWLCGKCNSALGLAKDDIEILEAMIDYLKRNKI